MTSVGIFDERAIGSLAWPETPHAARLRNYLAPMVRLGPRHFIDNADVKMLALQADGEVIPLVLADPRPGNSNVCSPRAHYVDYPQSELAKRDVPALGRVLRRCVPLLGITLRLLDSDRVAYVNNWLWATNPPPTLTTAQVAAITARLVSAFPDRAIVFRSVNRVTCDGLFRALRAGGYGMVGARKIYIFDGGNPALRAKSDFRRDLKLLKKTPYEVVEGARLADSDVPRLVQLYRMLYTGKYPSLNAQFNEAFFRLALEGNILGFRVLKRNGTVDAFYAAFSRDDVINPSMIGYDLSLPRKLGLYRLTFVLLILEAIERGIRVNLSAGAGEFKLNRGCVPTVEFDAVYDAHLPPHRRIPWWLLRGIYTRKMVETFGD